MESLFLLLLLLLGTLGSAEGLHCHECLSLTCASPSICNSIIESMLDPLFNPKKAHIEFNPATPCPTPTTATTTTTSKEESQKNVSQECPVQDSACLEANIEVITTFDGLRGGLELDPYSSLKSVGYIRACTSRKWLRSQTSGTTVSYRRDEGDGILVQNNNNSSTSSVGNGNYRITKIHTHEFYIDHGTEDAVTCYEDNCNDGRRRSGARSRGRVLGGMQQFYLLFVIVATIKMCTN